MPIYRQTYRTYDGQVRGWFRWGTIVQQELRVLWRSWAFRILLILGMLHVFFRFLQVLGYDVLAASPNSPLKFTAREIAMLKVDERMFFDFIRIQSGITFVTIIMAGSGMICNDFRHNLTEIYFSKPLRWWDYVLGKVIALTIVGLLFTGIPALALLILHNMFVATFETIQESWYWGVASAVFSLLLVLPCALGVLASSALLRSQRFAGTAVFMVLFGNLIIGTILPELLEVREYLVIAFPMTINHVGQHLFHVPERRWLFDLPWQWSAAYIGVVCFFCLCVICAKVRRAEGA